MTRFITYSCLPLLFAWLVACPGSEPDDDHTGPDDEAHGGSSGGTDGPRGGSGGGGSGGSGGAFDGPRGGNGGRGGGGGGGRGGGPGGPGGPGSAFPPGTESNPRVDCSYPIEKLIAGIQGEDTVPSWEQVDCYAKGIARLSLPGTCKSFASSEEEVGMGKADDGPELLAYQEKLASMPGANTAAISVGIMPPYFDLKTHEVYTYPLSAAHHDYKLRTTALYALYHKSKGRVVKLQHFWPPNLSVQGVNDLESYKATLEASYFAEKTAQAKMAEKYKIEFYSPLLVEIETVPRSIPFLAKLPVSEQVALSQWVLDKTFEAARPHFTGLLAATSHNNWLVHQPEWKDIDFSKWDEVDFTFYPSCDAPIATYLAAEMQGYRDVIKRNKLARWGVGEIDIVAKDFVRSTPGANCPTMEEFVAQEPELWRATLEMLASEDPAPNTLVGVTHGLNSETAGVVEEFFKKLN